MSKSDNYVAAAVAIGDTLLRTQPNTNGLTWQTVDLSKGKVGWQKHESLYSGTAGIALFLLNLYKATGENKYLQAVMQAAAGLEKYCSSTPTNYHAFYTGRMGVSYFFLQLAEATGLPHFKNVALQIAQQSHAFLNDTSAVSDLINGQAGALLGLLHVHSATQDDQVLKLMENFTNRIIRAIHLGEHGFYWDRSFRNIRGLCGYSHGASGIGYVFLELGRYFNNPTFYTVAEQAFGYEDSLFDTQTMNWPDFRKGYFTEESFQQHKKAYLDGDIKFFTTPGDMSAWCHGAPGIGLARLRAGELLGKPEHEVGLQRALNKTKQTTLDLHIDNPSYTLCHGKGGNALLFVEALKHQAHNQLKSWIEAVADESLTFHIENGYYISGYHQAKEAEDYSLFIGNSGIGNFLLHASGKLGNSTILKPDVSGSFDYGEGILGLTVEELRERLIQNHFPRTKIFLKDTPHFEFKTDSLTLVAAVEGSVGRIHDQAAAAVFQLEKTRFQLDLAITSHAYTHIQHLVETKKNATLIKEGYDSWKHKTLKLQPIVYRMANRTDMNTDDTQDLILLNSLPEGVAEITVRGFAAMVIETFETSCNTLAAVDLICEQIEIEDDEDRTALMQAISDQIKQAMLEGVLVQQ